MKKTWESPKLIVLVRARPQESILAVCKGDYGPTSGPNGAYWHCTVEVANSCPYCSDESDS